MGRKAVTVTAITRTTLATPRRRGSAVAGTAPRTALEATAAWEAITGSGYYGWRVLDSAHDSASPALSFSYHVRSCELAHGERWPEDDRDTTSRFDGASCSPDTRRDFVRARGASVPRR